MTRTFKPRLDILPPAQQRIWPELRGAAGLGFTLYGGTAIALRLGHRQSVDFDFFSGKPLDRDAIKTALPFLTKATTIQDKGDSWTVLAPYGDTLREHVKVSFFGEIAFGRVGAPEFTEGGVLLVASLDDLMATKVKVVLQRAEAKDYRDVAAMVNAGVSLVRGIASARLLFGPSQKTVVTKRMRKPEMFPVGSAGPRKTTSRINTPRPDPPPRRPSSTAQTGVEAGGEPNQRL